jgi:hypothetical protein
MTYLAASSPMTRGFVFVRMHVKKEKNESFVSYIYLVLGSGLFDLCT